MTKDWLHIPSLGRTIDFNLVSDIDWNKQFEHDKRFRTVLFLGTSLSVDRDYGSVYNEISIFEEEDRKKVYAKFPGIAIELLFDEELDKAPSTEGATEEDDTDLVRF